MVYSKTAEYAIRSLCYFPTHPDKSPATVRAVSQFSGVPPAYVAKIFQCLAQNKILRAQRGPAGGYSMVTPPSRLTLMQVVHVVDDVSKSSFENCVMGLDKCEDKNPCPLHEVWKDAKEKMLKQLEESTIEDVAALGRKFRSGRHRRLVLSEKMRSIFSV
jgi:Rrf2 family protein